MKEIVDEVVPQVEIMSEVKSNAADEIVALFCSYKGDVVGDRTGDDFVEICKGGEPFFKLKGGQFKKMAQGIAQWHVGKASRWDVTNPLQLSIKKLDEIDAMKSVMQAKKHAQANQVAEAAKAAKAETDRLEAEALAAAKVRRDLLDKALGAGVIKSSDEAEAMTNQDLADLTAVKLDIALGAGEDGVADEAEAPAAAKKKKKEKEADA